MSGSVMSRNVATSPGVLVPTSTIATSAAEGIDSRVSGTPMRLLRLPLVACTASVRENAALSSSLVLVLPFDPATAITLRPQARRHAVASCPSATRVSDTTYVGTPRPAALVASLTTNAAAPASRAVARKSCASKRSPLSATKTSPRAIARVSVDTPASGRGIRGPVPSASATRSKVQYGWA